MYNPFDITGRSLLITGAASGMGKTTAITCAKMGAKIVIADYNQEGLAATLQELEGDGHSCFCMNLADESSWNEMIDQMPAVDGIAHCAGISSMKPFQFIECDDLSKLFQVNFFGPVLLTKRILKKKKLAKGGSIVFVSSIDGPRITHPGNSIYSASKSALVGMARNMAVDLASKKIRVNCVLPGTTDTPLIRTSNVTEEELENNKKLFPMKRFANPQEIANGIIFLLSDGSSFMTGAELVIDGGYTLL